MAFVRRPDSRPIQQGRRWPRDREASQEWRDFTLLVELAAVTGELKSAQVPVPDSEMVWLAPTVVLVSSSMKWLRLSLVIQIILAGYFQLVLWLPLGAWNDQPGKRLITLLSEGQALAVLGFAFAMLLPVLLFALALWKRWFWLMWVGLMGYGVWAALQIQSWWIPWIFGADQRALDNQKFLQKTYKIFPSSIGHPAPDAMHFVLDLLIFLAVVTLSLIHI